MCETGCCGCSNSITSRRTSWSRSRVSKGSSAPSPCEWAWRCCRGGVRSRKSRAGNSWRWRCRKSACAGRCGSSTAKPPSARTPPLRSSRWLRGSGRFARIARIARVVRIVRIVLTVRILRVVRVVRSVPFLVRRNETCEFCTQNPPTPPRRNVAIPAIPTGSHATFRDIGIGAAPAGVDDVQSGSARETRPCSMPTVEERLTSLEARIDSMSDLRNIITELRGDMNGRFTDAERRFTEVNARFTELRADMNLRFAQVNGRFAELRDDLNLRSHDVTVRFTEMTGQFTDVNRRMSELDQKMDRHFAWLISTQVAVLLAVVGALVGALYR